MTKLIIGDTHIIEKDIPELEKIFQEIIQQDAGEFIFLGDYYDRKNPNARELLFGTEWACKFRDKYKNVIFLKGNHDKTQNISAIDYLKYLGIGVISEFTDENNNFYGHFMTNQSKYEYGIYKYTVSQLAQYNMVFLGHQHSFQEIAGHIWHLGSVRYVGFNEVSDKGKYILKLGEKPQFIQLHSPIPMVDIHSLKELSDRDLVGYKVRLIISSFDQFKKEINQISKYKNNYSEFKLKLEFGSDISKKQDKIEIQKQRKLEDIITKYIEKIEDKDVRSLLERSYKDGF
jgi:DNA repair exonuclease SbcCD nuclease subunit